jgi:hypothetical protein
LTAQSLGQPSSFSSVIDFLHLGSTIPSHSPS